MFKRVLLCDDGSRAAREALRRGAELAVLLKAEAYLLTVESAAVRNAVLWANVPGATAAVNPTVVYELSTQASLDYLTGLGVHALAFRAHGNVIDAIATYARKLSVDLIVVGHYPEASGRRWWSGTERAALAERVNCCVLIGVSD